VASALKRGLQKALEWSHSDSASCVICYMRILYFQRSGMICCAHSQATNEPSSLVLRYSEKVDLSTFFFLICGNCASWIILKSYTALSITGLRLPALRELPELHHCFASPSALARRRIPLYTEWFRRSGQYFGGGGVMVLVIVRKSICVIICVIVNNYRVRDVWIHEYKKTLWMVIRKEKLHSFNTLSWSSRFFMLAVVSKFEWAIRLVYPSLLLHITLRPKSQTKI
jgi:hypothetical protein